METPLPENSSPDAPHDDAHAHAHAEQKYITVPNSTLNVERFFHGNFEEQQNVLGDIAQAPGSSEDWAALIAVHEAEHALDDHQNKIDEYFDSVGEDLREDRLPLYLSTTHAKEIESDISAARNLDGQIPDEVIQYWAANRILASTDRHMEYSMHKARGRDIDNPLFRSGEHDTGFHLDSYLQTGEIPDYFETTKTVNGFYDKTARYYADEMQERFEENGRGDAFQQHKSDLLETPNAAQTIDIVRRALNEAPPVYTPAQQIIAQRYIDNMEGTLGIEPQSMNEMAKKAEVELQEQLRHDTSPEDPNQSRSPNMPQHQPAIS